MTCRYKAMLYSPKTTICGLLICMIILLVFVEWSVFVATGATLTAIVYEVAKILVAILILLLGIFAQDEPHH